MLRRKLRAALKQSEERASVERRRRALSGCLDMCVADAMGCVSSLDQQSGASGGVPGLGSEWSWVRYV